MGTKRQGISWSVKEEKHIYDQFLGGVAIDSIALGLERSTKAVKSRLKKLGLIDENCNAVNPIPPFTSYAYSSITREKRRKENAKIINACKLDESIKPDKNFSPAFLRQCELISERLATCLERMQVMDVRQIANWPDIALLRQPNLGRKTLNEWKLYRNTYIHSYISKEKDSSQNAYDEEDNCLDNEIFETREKADKLVEIIDNEISILENKNVRRGHILRLRLGIEPNESEPLTLEEVGNRYGITRERVRQIESKAIIIICNRLRREDNPNGKLIRKIVAHSFPDRDRRVNEIAEFFLSQYNFSPQNGILSLLCVCDGIYSNYKIAIQEIRKITKALNREYRSKVRQENRRKLRRDKANNKWGYMLDQVIWPLNLKRYLEFKTQIGEAKREINRDSYGRYGTFYSSKCDREVSFESNEEYQTYRILEHCDKVRWYQEQPYAIPYYFEGRECVYYPDVAVVLEEYVCAVIEVKPTLHMLRGPTIRKALIALDHFADLGIGYALIDKKGHSLKTQSLLPYEEELEDIVLSAIEKEDAIQYEELKIYSPSVANQVVPILINNDLQYNWGTISNLPDDLSYSRLLG